VKKKSRVKCTLLATALCLSVVLGACGSGTTNDDTTDPNRPELNLYIINGNYHEGAIKDSVWKYIEDTSGVTMNISGQVNNDDYYTSLSPRLNSANDMPDAFFCVPGSTGGAYPNWSDQQKGILYDWKALMAGREDEFPYLNKIFDSAQYKNINYDGAYTMLPFPIIPNSSWGVYYRADWLVKIGYVQTDASGNVLKDENGREMARVPVNMDEFQDVMMKFSDQSYGLNPNGQSYAMSPFAGEWANQPLYHAFGAPTDFDITEDGEIELMGLTEEYRNFLQWFNSCYEKGWIEPQFYTNTPSGNGDRKAFEEGRIGIVITNAGQHVIWTAKPMEDVFGKGTCIMGPPPIGTATLGKEGEGGWSNWGGTWGGFCITKACENTDAALRLFNYLYSPEGQMVRFYGIEGTHWEWNEDKTAVNALLENRHKEPDGAFEEAQDADGNTDFYGKYRFSSILGGSVIDWDYYDANNGAFRFFEDFNSISPAYAPLMQQAAQYYDMLETSKLANFNVLPPAMQRDNQVVSDLIDTYAIQAIAGQKNLTTDWDALLKACDDAGLQDILAVYKEAAVLNGLV
jgi:hypothetical protein